MELSRRKFYKESLNESNFKNFCAKFHKNLFLTEDILEDDLKILSYLKRCIRRYKTKKEINIGAALNHILVIYNIWGDAAFPILIYKFSDEGLDSIKALLMFLNKWPKKEHETRQLKAIPVDNELMEEIKRQTSGR